MKEAYKQLSMSSKPEYIVQAYRQFSNLNAPQEKVRVANYETWKQIGFADQEEMGVAKKMYSKEGYTIVTQIKNVPETKFDQLFICLPTCDAPIVHLPNKLPRETANQFYHSLNLGLLALQENAQEYNQTLRRVYVQQHVGPLELNTYPFNISFPQFHMHIIGVTDQDIAQAHSTAQHKQVFKRRLFRHTFFDPSIYIARDIYENYFQTTSEIDFTVSNLIVNSRKLDDLQLHETEWQQLFAIYNMWEKEWFKLASCFTDFETDANNRLVPLPITIRKERLDTYLAKYPFLSEQSVHLLNFLAQSIQPFDITHPTQAVYNGMAGSVGWVFNLDTSEVTVRVAPRLFVSEKKFATDGFFVGLKDKQRVYGDIEERLEIQKKYFEKVTKLINENA